MIDHLRDQPQPIEQAFALLGLEGCCRAGRTVEEGIRQANDVVAIGAWVSLGECLNRITFIPVKGSHHQTVGSYI